MHLKMRIWAAGLIAFLSLSSGIVYAEDDAAYKADFIVKLFDYVQWPAGSGVDSSGSAMVGILGDSSLMAALKSRVADKAADGMKITVKKVTLTDKLTDCQILFLPTTDKSELAKALKKIGSSPVVTVSDCAGFAGFGVMVNFFREEGTGKVKFEINTMVVSDTKLKFSSQLLKLAKII